MKMLITFLCFIVLFTTTAQNEEDFEQYDNYVGKGKQLYQEENYKGSAKAYEKAFKQLSGRAYPNDRYNAACSHALSGNIETSFKHLFKLAKHPDVKYKNLSHLTTDKDLEVLREDEQWDDLVKIVKRNKDEYEKDLDKPLVATLDSILRLDQGNRRKLREMWAEFGQDSDEALAQGRITFKTDSMNVIKVTQILDKRGWLGPEVIGDRGSNALFLVIQHAEIETQEKYLPMLRQAVVDEKARPSMLAYLQDRIAIRKGERQIYGSQIGKDAESGESYVMPLIDPENVNQRRAKVGLGTIEEYISRRNMTWDVDEHKERTKKIESERKNQ